MSINLMDLPWLGVCVCVCVCVCVWCGVNRNRKWVFSYVMQRLVPTHTGGWSHWPSVLRLIKFCFGDKEWFPNINFNSFITGF